MNPADADRHVGTAAAYVHIPFCSSICPYCDFAVVAGRDDIAERYIAAVCAEIASSTPWRPLDAVYFGGGTPSHVDARRLASVLQALDRTHGIAGGAEVSLEANPEDFTVEKGHALRSAGFNRVSFGGQSFDEAVLRELGRRHRPDQIGTSVAAAAAAGFGSISVDLIYGTPGETDASWGSSLEAAVGLDLHHISCYALTIERGTPLGRAVGAGAPSPDPDTQAERYQVAEAVLGSAGFGRYEVSNWARPGHECRYNLTVWAQGEYEAYGNGAHGFRSGRRFRNHRRLDAYMERVEAGASPRAGEEVVEGWEAELDRLFVGLRRAGGVRHGPGTAALVSSGDGERLMEAGVLVDDGERLRVLRPLLTDAVHRSVLGLDAPNVKGDGDA